ncbi:MAG TPA: aminotransferase class I/II-fold pyridoxal phosphate-dependent enzyme, partial [Candidatus Melainabacteria bacterium]|nr:aminotransferase class I/II-fold pyridoxal phosphate-dependent enzyme [Candidatus Melainabacteria bacterium]
MKTTKELIRGRLETPMHVGRPGLLNRELFLSRVNTILDNAVFTNNGPFVQELEVYVCKQLRVSHCIAVANATLGLELLLAALELQGEVIVPAFTFISTAQAILRTGLKPVFCDIAPQEQGSVSAQSVRKHITEKTSAILAVNLYGYAADVDGLSKLAAEHNLKLVFDSAHALGVKVNGKF